MGALRSGAGLVTVATPKNCQPIVAAMAPEYMTIALGEDVQGQVSAGAVDQVLATERDVIAVGPGLGTGEAVTAFVRALVERGTVPLVIDADGLNVLADRSDSINGGDGGRDLIITPHPGEMGRLAGISTTAVQANRIEVARNFATRHHVYVILKGHRTLIATPDGKVFINPTGNPGMASGGSGDLLAGMVAGWLGQLLDTEAACKLAVFLHGLAGDLAEADEGEQAMTASDIANHLGDAIAELTARRRIEKDKT
jgi:NAD(P)H-hydrate epimerase